MAMVHDEGHRLIWLVLRSSRRSHRDGRSRKKKATAQILAFHDRSMRQSELARIATPQHDGLAGQRLRIDFGPKTERATWKKRGKRCE